MSTSVVNTPEEFATAIFDGINGYPPIAAMPNRKELLLNFFDGIFVQAYAKESELRQQISKLEAEKKNLKQQLKQAQMLCLEAKNEN